MKKMNIICVKLDDEMLSDIDEAARMLRVSRSDIIRIAVSRFIRESKESY